MLSYSVLALTSVASVLAAQFSPHYVPAVSPLLQYTPYPSANSSNTTWSFDSRGYAYTTAVGTSVSFTWYGSGLTIGGVIGGNVVDNGINGICFGCNAISDNDGLSQQSRTSSLSLPKSGSINITGLVYNITIAGTNGVAISRSSAKSLAKNITSEWMSSDNYTLSTNTSGSSLVFSPPSNTSIFELYGPIGQDQGSFSVSVSPALPGGMNSNPTYNASSPLRRNDTLLYLAVLTAGTQYNVTVTNGDKKLDLQNVMYYWSFTSSASRAVVSGLTVAVGLVSAAVLNGILA